MKAMVFAMLPLGLGILLYVWQVTNYLSIHRVGLALAFTGYVIGNIGLAVDIWEQWGK